MLFMVKKLSTTLCMRLALCLMMMCLPLGVWADGNTTWTLVGEKCGTCANGDNGVISFQNLNNTAWGGGSVAGHTELSYPNCQGTQFTGSMPVADQKLISISQYEHSEVVPAHTKVVRKCVFQTVMATARYRHGLGLYLFDDLASATTTNLDAMPDQNAKALGNSIPEANLLLQQTDNDGFHSKEMVACDIVYDNSASDTEQTIKKYIVLVHVNTSGTTNLGVTGLEWAGFREMSDIDINFIPNGGTGIMDDQVITSSGTLNDCTYTSDGYTFIGWNTKADGTGTAYAAGTPFAYTGDNKQLIKLYAQWTANNSVLRYTATEGKISIMYDSFKDANGNILKFTKSYNSETGEGEFVFNGILVEIGNRALSSSPGFTSMVLPNSLEVIGYSAFNSCTGFTGSLTLPNSLKTIGECAYQMCSGFNGSLNIGNSVTSIGKYAFNQCGFTGSLTIPNSVETIGFGAFWRCTGFTSVTMKSIPNVGQDAFGYVTSNKTLVLDDNSYVASNKGSFPGLASEPTYTRQMGNELETLVVPFAITYTQGNGNYKLYQFIGSSGKNIAIEEYADNASIPAGTPMLIRALGSRDSNGKYEITLTAADKSVNTAITVPASMNGFTISGTYATKQVTANGGYMLRGNQFVKTTEAINVAPFRVYLDGSVDGVSTLDITDNCTVISFNANGGAGTMSQQVITESSTLNGNAFTRDNYLFTGWNTKADGSGTAYAADATFTFTEENKGSITLYAQWEAETLGDPVDGWYLISNAKQLYQFAELVNGGQTDINGKLSKDIDISAFQNLILTEYRGTLDGDGYTLTINIDRTANDAAFIQKLYGTVKNLTVAGTVKTSAQFAAGIAAHAYGCTISRCVSTVNIESSISGDGTHGGFIGVVESGTNTIENCHFAGSMSGSNTKCCGGFIGWSKVSGTTINNSLMTATFSVKTDGSNTFSRNPSNVVVGNCYYKNALGEVPTGVMQVSADLLASGEIAWLLNKEKTDGTQAWYQKLGAGGDACPVLKSTGSNTVYCSYETGKCTGTYNNTATVGSPVHDWGEPVWTWSADGTIAIATFTCNTDNYHKATPEVTMSDEVKKEANCGVKGTKTYTATTTFNNNTYTAENNVDIPATGNHAIPAEYDSDGLKICTVCHIVQGYQPLGNKVNDYYLIGNAGQLKLFADMVNGGQKTIKAKLIKDIDMSAVCHAASEGVAKVNWTPIGNYNKPFYGTFDGDWHTVSNLYFDGSSTDYVGLIGYTRDNATIVKVGVVGVNLNGREYVGGLCGFNYKATITNCYTTGTVKGSKKVGGVCGAILNTRFTNCYSQAEVVSNGSAIGGVCGELYDSSMTNSYATGTVKGYIFVGGVCGDMNASTSGISSINNCYATGMVSGSKNVGGVCGIMDNGKCTISNCYTILSTTVGYNKCGGSINAKGGVGTERFKIGEIAYLLNGSSNEGTEESPLVWGQNPETQTYPVLSGEGVHYARTMANQWGTIVLPFDVTIDNNEPYDFYTISSVSDSELSLTKMSGTLTAGTPVLIRRSGSATGVDIKPASTPAFSTTLNSGSSADGLTLTGAFAKKVLTNANGYIISNNSFWDITTLHKDYPQSEISIGAFRAYLAGTLTNSTSNAAQLRIGSISDTEIETALEVLGALTSDEDLEVFDLNGRRQNDLHTGVNVVKRGDKVIKVILK